MRRVYRNDRTEPTCLEQTRSIWFVLFIWLIWFIWSVWSNQTNETDQINKKDQPLIAFLARHSAISRHTFMSHAG